MGMGFRSDEKRIWGNIGGKGGGGKEGIEWGNVNILQEKIQAQKTETEGFPQLKWIHQQIDNDSLARQRERNYFINKGAIETIP
jgi:hypothetical protein